MDYSKKRLPLGEYDSCVFEGCDFSGSYLSNIHFLDCEFIDCNLSNANVKFSIFKEVSFMDSKLLGLKFHDCDTTFMSFRFDHCILNFASFYQVSLPPTLFKNCTLHEVDFGEADLKESTFENSDLDRAVFDRTVLDKVDFKTAFHFNIDPDKNSIKKAKFSRDGALTLLKKYDILL